MCSVMIIAEAGVNHNGSMDSAIKMVDAAKKAGADYIKFQTFHVDEVICKNAPMAEYQKINAGMSKTQYDMVKELELGNKEFETLANYCREVQIGFLSTPFDILSVEDLTAFNMDYWKIPSGEITNLPLLEKIAEKHKPILLSTGMSEVWEIEEAINSLQQKGSGKITLLQCNTEYPTPYQDVNLNAISFLRDRFKLEVGYSDHTLGYEVAIAAVALGATVIEKHFTLDRNMDGPDHKISLEPEELKKMVQCIRNTQVAMGVSNKRVSDSERKNIVIARKSIVARRNIKKDELLSNDNLAVKRPGNGISPMKWNDLMGLRASRGYCEDEQIDL